MKQKLFSLLTLLLVVCSSAWADPTYKSSFTDLTSDGEGKYYTYLTSTNNTTYISAGWMSYTGASTGSATLTINPATDEAISGSSATYGKVKNDGSRYMEFYVTGITSIKFYFANSGSSDRKIQYKLNGGSATDLVTVIQKTSNSGEIALNAATNNTIRIFSPDNDVYVCALKVTPAPTGPVDPDFSLTKTTIGTDETSQIQVGTKGNLDGIEFDGDVTFGTAGVVTVNATGVVTPVAPGTTTINFNTSAVAGKYNASTGKSLSITVTDPIVVKPVITPADGSKFVTSSQEITITTETEGASIYYTTDNSTPTKSSTLYNPEDKPVISETTTIKAIAVKAGYIDSEIETAVITKYVLADLTPVSSTTTWDWTSWNETLELNATTVPTNTTEATYADIATLNSLTLPSGFNGNTLMFTGQYPVRSKASQAGSSWKFKANVPGTVKVSFSDTGSSGSSSDRYLTVNGVKSDYYVNRNAADDAHGKGGKTVTTSAIPVSAGEVVLSSANTEGWIAIKITKIVFTPLPEPSDPVAEGATVTLSTTANMDGWRSYNNNTTKKYSVDANTKVYYASATGDSKVTLEEIAGGVPANTAVILHKTDAAGAAAEIVLTETDDDIADPASNELKVSTENQNLGKVYRLGYKTSDGVGFYTYTTSSAPAGIIYVASVSGANFLSLDFGEGDVTAISEIEKMRNGDNETFFDLQGRKVAQPTKGLYIVNGRKVIIK